MERSAVYLVILDAITPESLNRSILEGEAVAHSRFGMKPTEVSIPVIAIPAWRDVIEAHRVGPWNNVRQFRGMQVSYNTLAEGEEEFPVILFKYTKVEIE